MALERLTTCRYQVEQGGPWEVGLLLNDGDLGIITDQGELLEGNLWDYHTTNDYAINIGAILKGDK